ncbi:MAG: hypothetical protein ABIZ52_07510 [Candidatus Limnocylindrales bacterium]
MTRRRYIAAAVDVGSYSVHLLIAEVRGRRLRTIVDESAFLGLGREVDATGELGGARTRLLDALHGFSTRARAEGAASLTVVATDPFRRASDAAARIQEVRATLGIEIGVLGHEEEAMVALIGVQAGRPVLRETVFVDVGGGSTEVLVVGPGREPIAAGLPLGAARLSGMHVRHDPPTALEAGALRKEVRRTMLAAPDVDPAELIAVGGTARSLLRVGPRLSNRVLTRRRIRRAIGLLAAGPAVATADRYGTRLSRARVLPAGAAILLGALDRYGLDRLRVAQSGLREGVILAAHRAGESWRSEIRDLARGWDG